MVHAPLGLGEIVSWKPPKEIGLRKLRAALSASGLNPELAREMLPRNAFSRAAKALRKNRVIDQVDEDDDFVDFQFTRKHLAGSQYDYDFECILHLNKHTGDVLAKDKPQLALHAKQLLDDEQSIRRSNDITRLIQKLFDERKGDLVPIREQGGAYFVPQQFLDLVEKVQDLCNQIGGRMRRFRIMSENESTSESVAESMSDHFSDLLRDFRQSCETVTEDASETIVQRRTQALTELRLKLDAHKDLLRGYSDTIEKEMQAADEMLKCRIAGEPAPPASESTDEKQHAGAMSGVELLNSILDT